MYKEKTFILKSDYLMGNNRKRKENLILTKSTLLKFVTFKGNIFKSSVSTYIYISI